MKKLKVNLVEERYEVDGETLAEAIARTGRTQVYIAQEAGHADATYINRLCRKGRRRIGGNALAPILVAIYNEGVEVEGFNWALAETVDG